MTSMSLSRHFDRIAIALSAVCILHCLAVPLLAALLPLAFISIGDDGHLHEWMLWVVVPTSVFGFALGMRYHRRFRIPLTGVVGLLLVAFAAIVAHRSWELWAELVVSIAGSVILAGAHWKNFLEVRKAHTHE